MKPKRRLRDVFNFRRLRHASLSFAAAMAFGSGCMADSRPLIQENAPPATVTGCVAQPAVPAAPKLPYDEELFRQNDTQPPSQAVLAMTQDERIQYYMNKFCFTADTAANDNNPRDKAIVAALDTLRGVTFMGKPLFDLAEAAHLRFCALKHMPSGTAAQYLSSHDFVAAGQNSQPQGEVLDIAHEIVHAAQGRHGLLTYGYNWDIESRVRRNLVAEAAPVAMEYSVAYEKKLQGDSSYWDYLKKHNANTAYTSEANHQLFEKTYQEGITAGNTQDQALHAAAHAIFERVFDSDDWRRFYLTAELNSYIGDIAEGRYKDLDSVSRGVIDQDKIDLAGQIGDLPSYTKGAHVPAYADLFKGDQKMQWAYEAADIARYRQQFGADAPMVKELETQAAANKNPYLALDFKVACQRIEQARWEGHFKPTWQMLDDLLKNPPKPDTAPAAVNGNCTPSTTATNVVSAPRPAL